MPDKYILSIINLLEYWKLYRSSGSYAIFIDVSID